MKIYLPIIVLILVLAFVLSCPNFIDSGTDSTTTTTTIDPFIALNFGSATIYSDQVGDNKNSVGGNVYDITEVAIMNDTTNMYVQVKLATLDVLSTTKLIMYIDNSSDASGVLVDQSVDNIVHRNFFVLDSSVHKMNCGLFADLNGEGSITSSHGSSGSWALTPGDEQINVDTTNNLVQFIIPLGNWSLAQSDIFGFRVVATGDQIADGAYDTAPVDNSEAYDLGYIWGYIFGSYNVAGDVSDGTSYTVQ